MRITYSSLRYAVLIAIAIVLGVAALPHAVTAVETLLIALAVARPSSDVTTAGPALQLITGFVTAPSTTMTAWTMAAGDSLQISNCEFSKMVRLLQAWGDWQTAGYLGIRSPKMHDAVRGIKLKGTASDVVPLLPWIQPQRLYPQDVLIAEQSGSATAGDIETGCMLVHYEDLPGCNARFISPDDLQKRGIFQFAGENTIATGTAGGYSGSEAINAEFDQFKANTDYALVGYLTDTECAAIGVRGPDTGNYRLGGPGNETLRHVTADWFTRLSLRYGIPLIPVINSANKGATFVDAAQDENGADPLVNLIFVELAPR